MPNWCQNRLTVAGPAADLDALDARVIVADPDPDRSAYDPPRVLDYAALLPEPTYGPEPGGALPDWYAWRLAHWGVKWNHPGLATEERWPQGEDAAELVLEFETPWGPPIPFLEALGEAFPALAFRLHYAEEAMDLDGVWTHGPEGH